ncbi:MAG: hypothetical protein LBE14_03370 [Treponema sp.]|jgi:hypothetical protein|nr:hypothetical protein [Treponema sp.]
MNTLIVWNKGITPVRLGFSLPGTGRRLHDIVSGAGQDMGGQTELTVTANPRIITWTSGEDGEPPVIHLISR